MTQSSRTHWFNTVSLEHVERGVAGGFTQADHGRSTRLRRLRRGDRIAFYSPRTAMGSGATLQCFTALGTIVDDEPFQVEMSADFHPWRRRVDFEAVGHAPIRPMLAELDLVTDEGRWGLPFRRGLFEVGEADFERAAAAMRAAADESSGQRRSTPP